MVELEAAQDRIGQIADELIAAHKRGVKAWTTLLRDHADLALPMDATARANYIHCHVTSEMKLAAERMDGVEPNEKLDFFALMIDGDILLRFKFVGHGRPANVRTDRQRHLARQHYTEDMSKLLLGDDSLRPPTLLTCGYTLDGDELGRVEIRRDCVGHPPWTFDLYGGEAIADPIPMDGMADDARPATVKSRKREASTDQEAESDAG